MVTLSGRAGVLHRLVASVRQPRRARVFVVTPGGNVALIERHRHGLHYWAVPGGGIGPGESPAEAARREVREELGLDVVLERKVARRGSQVFYVARVETEHPLSLGAPEAERNTAGNSYEPVWVAIDSADSLWLRPPGATAALRRLDLR